MSPKPAAGLRWRSAGLRYSGRGAEAAHRRRPASCGSFRQPGACAPLLVDRPRHPFPSGGRRPGHQGHRPACARPRARLPGNYRPLSPKSQIYAGLSRSVARPRILSNRFVVQLPWGHNVYLLDAVKSASEWTWYVRKAIKSSWSRNVLIHQIEGGPAASSSSAFLAIAGRWVPTGETRS